MLSCVIGRPGGGGGGPGNPKKTGLCHCYVEEKQTNKCILRKLTSHRLAID